MQWLESDNVIFSGCWRKLKHCICIQHKETYQLLAETAALDTWDCLSLSAYLDLYTEVKWIFIQYIHLDIYVRSCYLFAHLKDVGFEKKNNKSLLVNWEFSNNSVTDMWYIYIYIKKRLTGANISLPPHSGDTQRSALLHRSFPSEGFHSTPGPAFLQCTQYGHQKNVVKIKTSMKPDWHILMTQNIHFHRQQFPKPLTQCEKLYISLF